MVKKIAKTFLGSIRCRLKGMTTSGGGILERTFM